MVILEKMTTKLLSFTLLLLGLSIAQGKMIIPAAALIDFNARCPGITPEWEKEGNGYEAEYLSNGAEISVIYDASGNFQYMESETDPASLPGAILETVMNAHPGSKVVEAETRTGVAGTEGQIFVVEIEKNGDVREILIDVSGNILSDIQEKKEKSKD